MFYIKTRRCCGYSTMVYHDDCPKLDKQISRMIKACLFENSMQKDLMLINNSRSASKYSIGTLILTLGISTSHCVSLSLYSRHWIGSIENVRKQVIRYFTAR